MHPINKGDVPERLLGNEAVQARQSIDTIINSGKLPESSEFDSDVYGHSDVKNTLKANQNNFCAYCGCSLQGDFAPVEHFRPKTGYQATIHGALFKPGYHWLAYDWSNLLCSCDECNSKRFKGNLFPLIDESRRNINGRDISAETPVLINPSEEDPNEYFDYDTWIIVPKNHPDHVHKLRAQGTIDILCLNGFRMENGILRNLRASLMEERKDTWDKACKMVDLLIEAKPGLTQQEARRRVCTGMNLVDGLYGFLFREWV